MLLTLIGEYPQLVCMGVYTTVKTFSLDMTQCSSRKIPLGGQINKKRGILNPLTVMLASTSHDFVHVCVKFCPSPQGRLLCSPIVLIVSRKDKSISIHLLCTNLKELGGPRHCHRRSDLFSKRAGMPFKHDFLRQ